ncbi:MAG: O-antigen ligase family protein [Anaerolineae bacterium]|nr:O-antigen ligase family protein [Anaerolineae bacterium]
MPGEKTQQIGRWLDTAEILLVLLATPLLLQPQMWWSLAVAVAVAILLVWLIQCFVLKQPLLPRTPLTFSLWVFLVFVVVGVLVSADPDLSRPNGLGVLLGIAWWRLLTRQAVTSERKLHIGALATLLLALGLTGLGLITTRWNVKLPQLEPVIETIAQLSRFAPTTLGQTHPNRLAATAVMAYPLSLVMVLSPRMRWFERLIWLIGVISLAGVLLLSQSRSAWLAMVVVTTFIIFALAIHHRDRLPRLLFASALLFGLVIAVVVVWRLPADFLQQIWTEPPRETAVGSLATLTFRQEVWRWAITAVGDFAFTGTGLAAFPEVVHRLYPIAISATYVGTHAHNIFLQTALDVGLPGLIAYLGMLLGATALTWKLFWQRSSVTLLALGAWAGIVALHVYGLTDAIEIGALSGILLWMQLGLITGAFAFVFSAGIGTNSPARSEYQGAL